MSLSEFPEKLNFVSLEHEVLQHWEATDAFRESLRRSEGKPRFTFYDGPPFATGLPHYGHILAGTIKDIVCRYAHQRGHHVERRFGWDCHGLPIEFEIEKILGIKSSHDVKAMGIAKYNAECRGIVMRYASEWRRIIGRMGRWIDFDNDYKTMNLPFMESVWWVFSELWKKGLVYRDFKVMPYSTACTTPLSNFECNMNYKDVSDPSAVVGFPLVDEPDVMVLAWTTTPWTLPSNLALCVHPDFKYLVVKDTKTQRKYLLAESRLEQLYKPTDTAAYEKIRECLGKDLVGKKYVPLFPYFQDRFPRAYVIISDTYVTADSGTGIVHSAPGFGEDDFRVCKAHGVIDIGTVLCPIDENGHYTSDVKDFAGRYIKDCDNDILAMLKTNGRLISKAAIVHSYPFCWRSDTPLIYRTVDAWFVGVEKFRDQLLANNRQSRWVPEFVQTKRFTNWLEDARDWNVSRNRYWGTPLPIWHSEDFSEVVCIGSVSELEARTGQKITDIHREFVDNLTIPSATPGNPPLRRVPQVFDCWFESGSMPYAQEHYPFENKEKLEEAFPADFIAEGLDQTRGWFYTLLVLSSALFDRPPFKNLIVNGLVLAEDGKKMSKRLKNYPDPCELVERHGADALRLYLINSPVVRAEPLKFKEAGVKEIVNDIFIPLFNAAKMFHMHAHRFSRDVGPIDFSHRSAKELDRWIIAASQTLLQYVHAEMQGYRLYTVVPGVLQFLDQLTNWYVRMNRRRIKGGDNVDDWKDALSTLGHVLVTVAKVLAPFTPFMSEALYQRLKTLLPADQQEPSVHFLMIPDVDPSRFDEALVRGVSRMIKVVDLIRVLRDRVGIPLKMPVREVVVIHPEAEYLNDLSPLQHYISDEINTLALKLTSEESEYVVTSIEGNMATLGKRLKSAAAQINKELKALSPEAVAAFLRSGTITVSGHALTMEDVKVLRNFKPGIENFQTNTDSDVLVLMDVRKDQDIIDSWRGREFVSFVQQARKIVGLVIDDVVDVWYNSPDPELIASIEKCRSTVSQTVRGRWQHGEPPADASIVGRHFSEEGKSVELTVVFTKPQ